MMNLSEDLINNIISKYDEECNEIIKNTDIKPTVFEILARTYDEDLVSRMLAYALRNDKIFLSRLLQYSKDNKNGHDECLEFTSVDVKCEKAMEDGRADIFVEAEDKTGKKYFLTIENKIFSEEHDHQTVTYCKYVERQTRYKDCIKKYLFLVPDFKKMEAESEHFKTIYYSDLVNLLNENEDVHIADFKRHIKKYLSNAEVKFMESEILVLENYEQLKEIMKSAENKWAGLKKNLISYLCCGETIDGLKANIHFNKRDQKSELGEDEDVLLPYITDNTTILHIFRKKWWHDDVDNKNKYYFYSEIKFDNNSPNGILCQQIIRSYDKNSIVARFVDNQCDKLYIDHTDSDNNNNEWHVVKVEKFEDKTFKLLSKEWQEGVKAWAKNTLNKYIQDMDDIFAKFEEFKNSNLE